MRTWLAMLAGKTLRFLLRLVRRGGGSALPGTLAFKIQPNLLEKAIASAPLGLVVVSGTAGKSSTTKVLVELLRAHGLKVFTNPSTANIRQGFYASVLQFGNLRGKIDADIAVMEWDEGHGAIFAAELKPRLAVLTNVLSDQLDRFVDPVFVQKKLEAIANSSQTVIANRDDKNITQIVANHANVLGFGLASSVVGPHPEYALNFGEHQQIPESAIVTHANHGSMSIKIGDSNIDFAGDYANLPQALNISAALLAASKLIRLDVGKAKRVVETMPPVFARDELVEISGRKVRLMLVQNPTSFQLNLNKFASTPSPLMMMAGRDIHDPSWLWTVNFDGISRVDIVSGFNAYELALRLHVANVEIGEVIPEIDLANDKFAELEGDCPTIVFSADAMRRTRRYLRLAK